MKKTYIEPQSLVIIIHQQALLAYSIPGGVNGNSDLRFGGGNAGDIESRTQEQANIWDKEW